MPGKNANFSQFEGPGRKYAPRTPNVSRAGNQRTDALTGLGTPPRAVADRAAEIDSATNDLVEISSPYIGGNRVVNRRTM